MEPNLTGMNFTEFEGPVKCKILPPRGLMIPLLPSHINGKLMFVLCRKCAEAESSTPCGHSDNDRSLTGTWISVAGFGRVTEGRQRWLHHFKSVRGVAVRHHDSV